jgi:histidyl-tRNA synthetase
MKNQKCKGMQDLLPEDMLRFRRIEDTFRTCCRNWGYQEVRTPTLEYLYLFTAAGTLTRYIPFSIGMAGVVSESS